MTTKPVHYTSHSTTISTPSARRMRSLFVAARRQLASLFRRLERAHAQSRYDAIRARQERHSQRDALQGLPLAEKQRLGLYHLID